MNSKTEGCVGILGILKVKELLIKSSQFTKKLLLESIGNVTIWLTSSVNDSIYSLELLFNCRTLM